MHMLIFDYIYRRPFSFSDPIQKIQIQQQRTYQCYCHLNTLMLNLLPAREKSKWWTKEGSDRLDNTKTCPLAVLTQCFVSCQ